TYALTSSAVMRPLNPVPVTWVRSTPSSRANLRTEGPACAREKPGTLIGGRSLRTRAGAAAPASAAAAGGGSAGRSRGGAAGGAAGAALSAAPLPAGAAGGGFAAGGSSAEGVSVPSARRVTITSPLLTVPPFDTWTFSTT